MATAPDRRLVWDWPLRLFHWALAVSVTGSWITGQFGGYDWRELHFGFGYAVVGLIIFRLVWGMVGPRHARFWTFAPRPGAVLEAIRSLPARDSEESVGHNPIGALAVFVMLLAIGVQASAGLFVFDDILYEGPWYVAVTEETADLMGRIHSLGANAIVVLIALHLAAVAWYTIGKGQRLVAAMLHGRKRADLISEDNAIASSRSVLALILMLLVTLFTWWLLAVAPPEPPPLEYW